MGPVHDAASTYHGLPCPVPGMLVQMRQCIEYGTLSNIGVAGQGNYSRGLICHETLTSIPILSARRSAITVCRTS